MSIRSFVGNFLQKLPNSIYVPFVSVWYNLKCSKIENVWIVDNLHSDGLVLASPSPKFAGGRMSNFDKFEQFFKIEKGDTVLDVGACIGDTTVPMVRKTGEDGYVIAVEPHPDNADCLETNITTEDSLPKSKIVRKAVSDRKGTVTLSVHSTVTGHSTTKLVDDYDDTIEVPCDTLDNITRGEKIDFAKIDIQGAEVKVLKKGAKRFLKTTKKIVVETHTSLLTGLNTSNEVKRILREHDYTVAHTKDGIVHAWKMLK